MLTVRGQQHSFSGHERIFLLMRFWDRKCLDMRGTRTTDIRIQAECSKTNYLSYQGPTFTSALCLNTGSGSVDMIASKVTFEMLAVRGQQHSSTKGTCTRRVSPHPCSAIFTPANHCARYNSHWSQSGRVYKTGTVAVDGPTSATLEVRATDLAGSDRAPRDFTGVRNFKESWSQRACYLEIGE